MANKGTLSINLRDGYEARITEKVDVELTHRTLDERKVVRQVDLSKGPLRGLRRSPQGLYRVYIDPPSYLPVSRFVNIRPSGHTSINVPCPVDPKKIKRAIFPVYSNLDQSVKDLLRASSSVIDLEGTRGQALYRSFNEIQKAGLFNILAKSRNTKLKNKRTVFSYLEELTGVHGDRLFGVISRGLREELQNMVVTQEFEDADDSLHHPPPGFERAGSFKSNDNYGNLQVSFFSSADEWRVDIDIDDASGLAHVFQVARNFLTGRPTHPFDIHEILLIHQQLDPGYRFEL